VKVTIKARVACAIGDIWHGFATSTVAAVRERAGAPITCTEVFDAEVEIESTTVHDGMFFGSRVASAPRLIALSIPQENRLDIGGGQMVPICTKCMAIMRERRWVQ
jgi:hypothetical protein